jgi:hypothetical protein
MAPRIWSCTAACGLLALKSSLLLLALRPLSNVLPALLALLACCLTALLLQHRLLIRQWLLLPTHERLPLPPPLLRQQLLPLLLPHSRPVLLRHQLRQVQFD